MTYLDDWSKCLNARESLLRDERNYSSSRQQWNDGCACDLSATAQRKLYAIQNKMDKFCPEEEE